MFRAMRWMIGCAAAAAVISTGGCTSESEGDGGQDDGTGTEGQGDEAGLPDGCARAVPAALQACVAEYSTALRGCYEASDATCEDDDMVLSEILADTAAGVAAACDGETGFGLEPEALSERVAAACASESSSLAWRSFGGPQGDPWAGLGDATRTCLTSLHAEAATQMQDMIGTFDACAEDSSCDAATLEDARATAAAAIESAAAGSCDGVNLAGTIAVDVATYAARAVLQGECLTAVSVENTGDVTLACGPSNAEFTAPRGVWTQIVVDGEKWGTRCGDGSEYAFQIRLAPEGAPLDRVVIGLQGGGVCIFEDDCGAKFAASPGLFNALDDVPFEFGISSSDPDESPFADWTKVYLPYCTQDVFAGGGVVETFANLEVPRFGAVNLRAAMRMVRDVMWREMDAAGGAGFRPDEVVALFGGWSAGGYGTLYNYHWMLDDLQWPKTAAFPDAGMALDNGEILGVAGLGQVKIPTWGTQPLLPPYCFEGTCAVGPVLYEAISPRLKRVPEQQFLIVSNPRDLTQQGDAYFSDEATWINTMRQSVCDTRDLPGINYYLTSVSDESIHVVSIRPELWAGSVDGEAMRDWFWRAVTEPDTLVTRVEEADFVDVIPGVMPYPCAVAP